MRDKSISVKRPSERDKRRRETERHGGMNNDVKMREGK